MMKSKILSNIRISTQLTKQFIRSNYTQEQSLPDRIEKTINQVTLLGRVGGDPQKRGSEEHPVVVFSLATHQSFLNNNDENTQKTAWHRVVIFRPGLREAVYKYLQKGQRVHVSGRIIYGELKDESGNIRTTTSIAADDIIFFNAQKV